MELLPKDLEKIESVKNKAKELINDQAVKVLVDIESYTARVAAHQSASSGNIENAIAAGRAARDRILEIKSDAIIKIDNIVKNIQTNKI